MGGRAVQAIKMKVTGISKKCRRFLPIVICIVLMYNLYNYWPKKEDQTKLFTPKSSERSFEPPTQKPSGVWLIAANNDDSMCISLAASFPEWNILLVVPKATNLTHSRCRFLILNDLQEGNEDFFTLFGNDTAKLSLVMGTQQVVKYTPTAIYVATTPNLQSVQRSSQIDEFDSGGLLYSGDQYARLFSGNRHFGCNMNNEFFLLMDNHYTYCHVPLPAIQASVVLSYSNRETVFNFGSSKDVNNEHIKCDTSAPPVVLDHENYALVNFDSGMFRYDFIWAVGIDLIATKANERRWLVNMGIQKLVWRLDNRVKVYLDNKELEKNLATVSEYVYEWIGLIDKWSCSDDLLQSCIVHLMLYLRDLEMLKHSTVRLVQEYLSKLEENSYDFPYMFPNEGQPVALHCDKDPVTFEPVNFQVQHSPRRLPVNNLKQFEFIHQVTCDVTEDGQLNPISFASPWLQFQDILLIVVFNKPHYEALVYVELLYKSFFPRIMFCGPEFPDRTKHPYLFTENGVLSRTFISYGGTPEGHVPGSFNYACLMKAINMQYNLAGYLVIADDTLLLVNNIKDFRRDAVWFLPKKEMRIGEITKLRECKLGMCDFFPHWAWWEDYQNSTISLLKYMHKQQQHSLLIYNSYQQLVHLNGGHLRPSGGYSDVYYIPQRLASDFAQLSSLFLEYQIFLEIAVPTIIRCLEYPGDIVAMENKIIWDESRDEPWRYFTKHHLFRKVFYHPAKWGYLTQPDTSTDFKEFYCKKVLPFLHDPLERLPKDPASKV